MDFLPSSNSPSSSYSTDHVASAPSSSSSSASSSSLLLLPRERCREYCLVLSVIARRVVCAAITCIFSLVGSLVGAITGALIGLATESGLLRGAGIGAISGAVFCIEAVESSLDLWNSRGSGIWSILFLMDIISSLLSGRLVREKVGPAVQSAVQSQMSAIALPFMESSDFFETGDKRGLSKDCVDRIPQFKLTALAGDDVDGLDAAGDHTCCSVCLQDFEIGDAVRSLPSCRHIFHSPCIDNWLIRHGSCPLCRHDVLCPPLSSVNSST